MIADGPLHKAIPILAGCGLIDPVVRAIERGTHSDPAQPHMQHQAIEAAIGDQQIAAAPKDKKTDLALAHPIRGLHDVVFRFRFDKPARRPPDAKRSERPKRFVFFQEHQIKATTPRLP